MADNPPGSPNPAVPPSTPPAPAPTSPGQDSFHQDVTDWMADLDERVNALGRAVRGLVDATAHTVGAGQPPSAPTPPQPTQIVPNPEVKADAAKTEKRRTGLFW